MARQKKTPAFSAEKEVKALAREQVGQVKATRVETPKKERKPKHKLQPGAED